eukprot:scaffold3836_cov125-Isochrysis_galbana.AAC.5
MHHWSPSLTRQMAVACRSPTGRPRGSHRRRCRHPMPRRQQAQRAAHSGCGSSAPATPSWPAHMRHWAGGVGTAGRVNEHSCCCHLEALLLLSLLRRRPARRAASPAVASCGRTRGARQCSGRYHRRAAGQRGGTAVSSSSAAPRPRFDTSVTRARCTSPTNRGRVPVGAPTRRRSSVGGSHDATRLRRRCGGHTIRRGVRSGCRTVRSAVWHTTGA